MTAAKIFGISHLPKWSWLKSGQISMNIHSMAYGIDPSKLLNLKYRGWESNPHASCGAQDFKSLTHNCLSAANN